MHKEHARDPTSDKEDIRLDHMVPGKELVKLTLGLKPDCLNDSQYERYMQRRIGVFFSDNLNQNFYGLIGLLSVAYVLYWLEAELGVFWLALIAIYLTAQVAAHFYFLRRWKQERLNLRTWRQFYRVLTGLLAICLGCMPLIHPSISADLKQHAVVLDFAFILWVCCVMLWQKHDLAWAYLMLVMEAVLFYGIHIIALQNYQFYMPIGLGIILIFSTYGYSASRTIVLHLLSKEKLRDVANDLHIALSQFKDNASDWLMEVDRDGIIREFPAATIARYPQLATNIEIGETTLATLVNQNESEFASTITQFKNNAAVIEARVLIRTTNNEPLWWRLRGRRLTDSRGRFTGYRIVCGDISLEMAHQEMEQRRLRHDAIINMSGFVAHDFNNCLSSISSSLGVLREDPAILATHGKFLDTAQDAVRVAARTTRDLLAFSNGDVGLTPQRVLLAEVIDKVTARLKTEYGPGLSIEVSGDRLLSAIVDPENMERAVFNVANNAAQAMRGQGRITIDLRIDEGPSGAKQAVITIADEGPGVREDATAQLFEPFYTTKKKHGGNGLGLAMARAFARQLGGDLNLIDRETGAAFQFSLPLIPDAPDPPSTATDTAPIAHDTTGDLRVLLIEDEDGTRQALSRFLEIKGFKVSTAADLAEARGLLESRPFDLVLSDVMLPDGNAMEIWAELHGPVLPDHVPVIVMTGYSNIEIPSRYTTLIKPFELGRVEALIHNALQPSVEPA